MTATKNTILGIVILAVGCLTILAFVYRADLQLFWLTIRLNPKHAFGDAPPPTPPDYTDTAHWAALPDRKDPADSTPRGAVDLQTAAAADVFFIHPTTFLSRDAWNQSLDDEATNRMTDQMVMLGQASVFNGCCRVYAPRYRQATLAAFYATGDNGRQALDLAFQDVVTAFRYYIAHFNEGRPFILASHSQGSRHADLLVRQEIIQTDLMHQLIAAYLVGFPLDASNGLAVCDSATQTGCQITWNTVGPDAGDLFASPTNICVNPLTWRADTTRAAHAVNLGAVNLISDNTHESGAADAQCLDGRLYVSEIRSDRYGARPLGRDNYHVFDYALFYVNIRQNAEARVDTFLRQRN
jgi:hypothetical protein